MMSVNMVSQMASPASEKGFASSTATPTEALTPPLSPPPAPRTISELISLNARHEPNKAILGYPSHGIEYEEYSFAQLDRFASVGAYRYSQRLPFRTSSKEEEIVIAILGPSTLEYLITILALSRIGFTVLFLSTRISEAAYVSLLSATKCSHIAIDPFYQRTVSGIQKQIPALEVVEILQRSEFDLEEHVELRTVQRLSAMEETNKISWIIHSSGSTGLPKPIYQTHKAALRNYEQNMNMQGFITLPLFHAHGLSSVFRGITAKKKIFMYSASLPLTSQNLLDIMRRHTFEIFYGVPYALKLLSESNEGIEALAKMQVVMFGGSACPDGLGDLLVEGGVNLISHYGTTETGQLMTSFRPKGDRAWNYVRVHDKLEPYVRFEDRGGNLFELVVLDGWPSKVATNREDGSYATKDLFEPHPSIKGAWKYGGRLDDTIVLMNGEKAIPLAMEGAVRQHRLVKDAVMFGAGRSRLGMIIIASDAAVDMPAEDVVEIVWTTIEKENQNSPAYAHLAPETIVVLPAGTSYPQTDKGTLIRQAFYKSFAKDIDVMYQRLEASANGTLVLEDPELRAFLRNEILKTVPGLDSANITDSTDLFSLGIDSLQSTRLRSTILQHLQLNGHPLSQNFVFENPSIFQLADAIIAVRDGQNVESANVEQEMADLVSKYTKFPQHFPKERTSTRNCIVVTGATGSLGAHVVAQLVEREDVTEVCCLVRARSEENARERVIKSMTERGIYESLSYAARQKITAYPADFSKPNFGLSESLYERLLQELTNVIHCAWSVNFNKKLSSFEADCVAGARNLILLCLSVHKEAPASFNFCSSVSTVVNTPGQVVPESIPESFACAQNMGYAQSKLVTENIVASAAAQTGIQARVLRIGQIVADTVHGIWNDTEAIPLMLQAATTIGALPTLDEFPRWLPVDIVAETVLDISLSSTSKSVFNVVNPDTFHWTDDLLPKLRTAGLNFEEVGQKEWVARLRASDPDITMNPTFKLIDFFASKYDNDITKRKCLDYETVETEALSPILASRPQMTQDFVSKFVRHFLATSWKSSAKDTSIKHRPRF